eukprot:5231891-Prymnesium_polylepis.1
MRGDAGTIARPPPIDASTSASRVSCSEGAAHRGARAHATCGGLRAGACGWRRAGSRWRVHRVCGGGARRKLIGCQSLTPRGL